VLLKCVAGVYTEVAAVNITYGAGNVLRLTRDGTSYSVHYDSAEVIGATTIADAVFASARKWGVFSTHSDNSFDDYVWEAI
jgi:hypothetical protein